MTTKWMKQVGALALVAAMPALAGAAAPGIVSFKDAKKIKSWDAWGDVVSYNIYTDSILDWRLPEKLDAPVLIGEFHFGAHDRGLFGSGLVNAGSQEGRAAALKAYVASALRNPQVVGVHWHQFSDQATSGRFDGEYFQVGWTDICDRPYPETVKALREVGYPLYETRAAAK